MGVQRGAKTHPDRVGGPVGAGGGRGGGGRETASSDQNQLVPSTLPPYGLGGVETTAEETVCKRRRGGSVKNKIKKIKGNKIDSDMLI